MYNIKFNKGVPILKLIPVLALMKQKLYMCSRWLANYHFPVF